MLPNFLICGTEKGGTSALFHYLKAHPEVFMPEAKELNFFNFNYFKGIEWYERYFAESASVPVRGEASPLYMAFPEVPRRIAQVIPEAKLLFVLRDPAERAYSNYWFNVNRGVQYPQESFSKMIRRATGYRRYLSKGFYSDQIAMFLPHFSRDQFHFIITEEMGENTPDVLKRCFRFLDLADHEPEVRKRHNRAQLPRGGVASAMLNVVLPVQKALRPLLPARIDGRLKQTVRSTFFTNKEKPAMSEEDRAYLQDVYREPNEQLAELIGQDLSAWI